MTPAELRAYLEAATPGPWRPVAAALVCTKHPKGGPHSPGGTCEFEFAEWAYEDLSEPQLTAGSDPRTSTPIVTGGCGCCGDAHIAHIEDARLIALLRNIAPLLLQLWEAAIEADGAFSAVMPSPLPPEEEPMDVAMLAQFEALERLRKFRP